MSFTGRSVLVTGGSRGIGRAIARAFAAAGARVAIAYSNDGAAAGRTLAELPGAGHVALRADLGAPADVHRLAREAFAALGRIDVLVNNAAIYLSHPPLAGAIEDWQRSFDRVFAVNFSGAATLATLVGRHMAASGGGRIINISSRGAFRGVPDAPGYAAAKAALNQFSQSMAQALAPHRVGVYVIAPAAVESDMTAATLAGPQGEAMRRESPLGRVGRPEEIAATALFLAGPDAEFLTGGIVDAMGASYLRN
ncbi:MAG: SDR family NAD(P)-dependent oxidoreductase [Gammaproteobacteria bacterium]